MRASGLAGGLPFTAPPLTGPLALSGFCSTGCPGGATWEVIWGNLLARNNIKEKWSWTIFWFFH